MHARIAFRRDHGVIGRHVRRVLSLRAIRDGAVELQRAAARTINAVLDRLVASTGIDRRTITQIVAAVGEMARALGVFPSPEGAATWAGLKRLVREEKVSPSARIVIVNTAGGARYRFLLDSREP